MDEKKNKLSANESNANERSACAWCRTVLWCGAKNEFALYEPFDSTLLNVIL